jgi:hypothetical protein
MRAGLVIAAVLVVIVALAARRKHTTILLDGPAVLAPPGGLQAGPVLHVVLNVSVAEIAWPTHGADMNSTRRPPCIFGRAAGRYVQAGPLAVVPAGNGQFVCPGASTCAETQQSQRSECLAECIVLPGLATRACLGWPGSTAAFEFDRVPASVWLGKTELTVSPIANTTACINSDCVTVGSDLCAFAVRVVRGAKPLVTGNSTIIARAADEYSIQFLDKWTCFN